MRKPSFQERVDRCGRIFASTVPGTAKTDDRGDAKRAEDPRPPRK